jgi:hypothetical protein
LTSAGRDLTNNARLAATVAPTPLGGPACRRLVEFEPALAMKRTAPPPRLLAIRHQGAPSRTGRGSSTNC